MHPIVKYLLKFFFIYTIFTILYQSYLYFFNCIKEINDPFTNFVTNQVVYLSNLTLPLVYKLQNPDSFSNLLMINGTNQFTAIVNEGCNGISIYIIFISFILTFNNTLKKTSKFILIGLIILNITNVLRISLISHINYFYHPYTDFFHDYIFPSIIWFMVLILWFFWMKLNNNSYIN